MPSDRKSLNRVFWDLGLRFQWDEATWSAMAGMPDLRSQLAFYLERYQPHLLNVYDVDFLTKLIDEHLHAPASGRIGIEAHHSC